MSLKSLTKLVWPESACKSRLVRTALHYNFHRGIRNTSNVIEGGILIDDTRRILVKETRSKQWVEKR